MDTKYLRCKSKNWKIIEKGKSASEIALCVGYSTRTIQREIKRGLVEVTYTKYDELAKYAPDMKREYITKIEYSAQVAENDHVEKVVTKE